MSHKSPVVRCSTGWRNLSRANNGLIGVSLFSTIHFSPRKIHMSLTWRNLEVITLLKFGPLSQKNQVLNTTYLQNQAFHVRLICLPCSTHHRTYLNSLGFTSFKNFHTIAFYHSHKVFRSSEMFQMEDQDRRLGTACFCQLQCHQLIPRYIPYNLARFFVHLVRSKTLNRNRKYNWVTFYMRNMIPNPYHTVFWLTCRSMTRLLVTRTILWWGTVKCSS